VATGTAKAKNDVIKAAKHRQDLLGRQLAGRGEHPQLAPRPARLQPAEAVFRIGEIQEGKGCLCVRFANLHEISAGSPQTEAFMVGCWTDQQRPTVAPEDWDFVRFDHFGFTFRVGDLVVATRDGMKLVFKWLIESGSESTLQTEEVQFDA
jgi:hypothetical protein